VWRPCDAAETHVAWLSAATRRDRPTSLILTRQALPGQARDAESVRALLLESGLWTALRTRPFGRVAAPDSTPAAIFVTATDTRPHAVAPATIIAERAADFHAGLEALVALAPKVYACVAEGHRASAPRPGPSENLLPASSPGRRPPPAS